MPNLSLDVLSFVSFLRIFCSQSNPRRHYPDPVPSFVTSAFSGGRIPVIIETRTTSIPCLYSARIILSQWACSFRRYTPGCPEIDQHVFPFKPTGKRIAVELRFAVKSAATLPVDPALHCAISFGRSLSRSRSLYRCPQPVICTVQRVQGHGRSHGNGA